MKGREKTGMDGCISLACQDDDHLNNRHVPYLLSGDYMVGCDSIGHAPIEMRICIKYATCS